LRSELLDFPLSLRREVSEVYQQLPVLIFARGHFPSCLRSRFVQPAHAVVGAAATARTTLSFHSRLKGKKHKLTVKSLNVTGVTLFSRYFGFQMNKKRFLTLTIIILTALALIVYNSKLPAPQAQPSSSTVLTITGLVQNPLSLTLNDIEAMPQTTEYAILICVNAPTIPLEWGNWTGVQLSYLLQQADVNSDAVKVGMFAPDGFEADLTVQMATQDNNILVAYQFNSTSLPGLQLVVPNNYGYKWISDLTQIQLVNYNFLGTEERAGYSDDATITASSGNPSLPNPTLLTQATPTPNSTPTPTASPQSPLPTGSPTTSPATSSPKPQSTSTFPVYIATVSIIVVVAAVVSAATLIKRKKAKALKREEAARVPSSL